MPRVHHVKKARKDNAVVKKGEPYYWWEFRYGGRRMSATPPRRAQLTQSPFKSTYFDLQDRIEGLSTVSPEDLETERDDIVEEIENLTEEAQESLNNLPEQLQESHMLNERVQMLEDWKDCFESVDTEVDLDGMKDDAYEDHKGQTAEDVLAEAVKDRIDEIVTELIGADPGIE